MFRKRNLATAILVMVLVIGLAVSHGCAPADDVISVGSKEFTEQLLMAQMTMLLLEEHGFETADNSGLGGTEVVREALEAGEVDIYWEYTGTGWMALHGQDDPLFDPEEAYQKVSELDQEEGIVWLDYAPLNNTYALLMRQEDAEEQGLENVSDLAEMIQAEERPLGDWAVAVTHEYEVRPDGVAGLEETYGFEFDEVVTMDMGILYGALRDDEVPLAVGFATDGRIVGFDLVILEDDQDFHPVYNAAPTIRQDTLEENPEIEEILGELTPLLDSETMSQLNAEVDIDEREPAEVAREFLEEQGLIGANGEED